MVLCSTNYLSVKFTIPKIFKGKLSASVKWLIGRVYGSTAPDLLVKPIKENNNVSTSCCVCSRKKFLSDRVKVHYRSRS